MLDLAQEPVSISVYEHEEEARIGFSDLPEQLLPSLVKTFGKEAVAQAITPSEVEVQYFKTLSVSDRTQPRYLELLESGEFERRVDALQRQGLIAKRIPYFMAAINRSDEAILGRTGAVYFVCRKGCHFCQYRDFVEHAINAEELAERMIALQEAGADNIQWVSPTAYTRVLLKSLFIAAKEGLKIPIVHNSEGEDPEADLGLLNGLVDMYLPDVKFIRPEFADKIGLSKNYGKRMQACLQEMYRQVGPLKRASGDRLLQGGGVLARHLVMPGGVEEARAVFEFLQSIDVGFPVHVMTQYQPLHAASQHPDISRHITADEIAGVVKAARSFRMSHVYVR